MTCFECGKQIHAPLQRFVSQDVYPPEEGNTNKITIHAHIKCAETSPNKWPGVKSTEIKSKGEV